MISMFVIAGGIDEQAHIPQQRGEAPAGWLKIVFGSPVSGPEKDYNRTGPRPQKTGPVVWSFHF